MSKVDNIILIRGQLADYLKFDVEKYLETFGEDVANTKELRNVVVSYSDYPKTDKPLATEIDKEERKWLLKEIDFAIDKINKDEYTRQAIIYNLHDSGLEHNCLNVLHLF